MYFYNYLLFETCLLLIFSFSDSYFSFFNYDKLFFNLKLKKEIDILMKNKRMNLFVKSGKKKVICGEENNSNSIFYLNVS